MNDEAPKTKHLRLGTRASALALWQAKHVRDALLAHWGDALEVTLVKIVTKGDQILDRPLNQVGGKGLFVNAIEDQLLAGEIDLAVHSMKDLPGHPPEGLAIVCTPERADPRDALVGPPGSTLAGAPAGTRLGTSSLRRGALARRINPGLEIVSIRGNVPTRIAKIEEGVVDLVLLAAAGLQRLGLDAQIVEYLDIEAMCPAAGQGILALETRAGDAAVHELLAPLEDPRTAIVAAAERAFLARLEGGCQVPMACHAQVVEGEGEGAASLHVRGLVVDPSGAPLFDARKVGDPSDAAALGRGLAETLLRLGAGAIIEAHKQAPRRG
ncbi:Porphobilinogen deaminase [Enhygromyxa salina]|uniref:Porphobilinogen deaminase n=1 Tax=Enhygromyxa salina TaxID=215803 RepID=A0A2S9XAW8_9BACT|nr:hydroxymethylbilane synthase [Enhygromyxa salina]PRP89993.1 Porphobilinogen deaminase [Enhygromyxa salina]